MALNINKVTSMQGNFLGSSSARPICGVAVRTAYAYNISQAKLTLKEGELGIAASPLIVKNKNLTSTKVGSGLSPNVLSAEISSEKNTESGFLLVSDTDILDFGDTAPTARDTQIVYVGLIGSGVVIYLPADATLADIDLKSRLAWDYATKTLKVDKNGSIKPLSPILDGVKIENENGQAIYKDCKCIKVSL